MFSSSCGCGFLINKWLAGPAAVEAISSVVLPVPLHFRVVTGSESGWVSFFLLGFFSCWGVFVVLWGNLLLFGR